MVTPSNNWIVLLILFLGVPSLSAQDAPVTTEKGLFHWKVVPGTRRCELYVSDHRIGLWDADKRAYYKINADGSMVGPLPPPFPIRSRSTQPSSSSEKAPVSEPAEEPEKKGEEASPAPRWYQDMPPWTAYVIGGAVTLLITCVGMGLQFRRK